MNLRTSEGLSNATRLFKDTLVLAPDFIDAAAALAQAYNLSAQYVVLPPEEAYPLALVTARGVLAQEPDHPAALAALAFATFYWLRDFSASYDLFERALKFDPNNADVHHWYALAVMHDRKFDIALREIEAAQSLSPTSPSILANKALIFHHADRHDEALAILEPLGAAQPKLLSPISYLATIYLDIGRDRDFIAAYSQAADLLEDDGRKEIAEAASQGLARSGRSSMLDRMLAVQSRLFEEGRERAFKVAITAAYLERVDLTLDYLDLAIRRNEPDVLGARLELPGEILNGSQRYNELVTRIGFSVG
jgi:tetratricopeptide (TPR) repeat protein